MRFDIESAEDLAAMEKRASAIATPDGPKVLNVADLLALDVPEAKMLIEGVVPAAGASLIVGAAKSGKTLAAVQMAIAVARGEALYGNYRVLSPGPSLIVEQDDPAAAGSVKTNGKAGRGIEAGGKRPGGEGNRGRRIANHESREGATARTPQEKSAAVDSHGHLDLHLRYRPSRRATGLPGSTSVACRSLGHTG
jgi:hypothetical protein